MRKVLITLGVIVMLLLAAVPSSAVAGQDVCRDLPSGTQVAGSVITVSLDTTVGSATYYGIDEMVPSGWAVISASDAGDFTSDPGHVKWAITSGAADIVYTYTVQIPVAASGTYAFSGVFEMEGMSSDSAISCDSSVIVGTTNGGSGVQDVCRDLPSGTQAAGSVITVSLDTTVGSATFYGIDEMVPSGWTVISASNAGDFTSDPGHVKWAITSGAADIVYTYTVQIPVAASGTYAFSGVFEMEGMSSDSAISCDSSVIVGTTNGGSGVQDVCRDLPSGTQAAGSVITVSLDTTVGSATFYGIDEMVPSGWTVISASNAGDFTSDPGHVKWAITSGAADIVYTYTVQIPVAASGTYAFSGVFEMEGMSSDSAITCDEDVVVAVPVTASAVRTLPASVERGENYTVSMDVSEYGTTGTLVETIPVGFTYVSSTIGATVVNEMVTFALGGETSFEYNVTASNTEGPYSFSGMLTDDSSNDVVVSGDTLINVVLPDGIVLNPGWNLISVPFELENSSIDSVFTDVNYSLLTYYDASVSLWNGVTTIDPLKGYWIMIPDGLDTQVMLDEVLVPKANTLPAQLQLYAGWNCIGHSSMDDLPAEFTLRSVDDSYDTIWGPWIGMYEYIGYNNDGALVNSPRHVTTDNFKMSPYEGYWVYMTQADMLRAIG